jgi:hypothetical protein
VIDYHQPSLRRSLEAHPYASLRHQGRTGSLVAPRIPTVPALHPYSGAESTPARGAGFHFVSYLQLLLIPWSFLNFTYFQFTGLTLLSSLSASGSYPSVNIDSRSVIPFSTDFFDLLWISKSLHWYLDLVVDFLFLFPARFGFPS